MTIVVPVRLATQDRVIQTTSRELTASSVLVATQQRLRDEELLDAQLYLPDGGSPVSALSKVRDARGELWLDLLDAAASASARIRDLIAKCVTAAQRSPHRASTRYPASIPASIEAASKRFAAKVTDISSGGVFVRCRESLEVGSLVSMKLLVRPDEPVAMTARIIHVSDPERRHAPWVERGFGLQFVDGDDECRRQIDAILAARRR
ncbi:MAG: PilZ domain-containing protein [Myxococcales bacterium]|nr:PilZ domain-containing protein [Myxococcales bacterium]